ncbi:palmitoyltransferase ZDHHC3-like [Molossus molossus]|uniref:palmitoyltransferase ZDHHC3-like n=1 Tax=Molossus molossus TaxID=27622 RepID=UPI001746977E|nr:palmitoyltransferase ZDHHC3-like [Molossus molossus]
MWFVRDVPGIACAVSTWLLVLSGAGLLLVEQLWPAQDAAYGWAHGALSHLLAFLALAAHLRTMLTDPGALPEGSESSLGVTPRCPQCGAVPQPLAHHCFVCGRCIRRADHHCPWVNNCVGEDNRKYFVLFTLYTALAALHVLLLLAVPALRAYAQGLWDPHAPPRPRAPRVFLFFVALEGFLFATLMFAVQMHSICTDQSRRGSGGTTCSSVWMNLKDVLGHPASLAWMSPFVSPEPQRASGHHDVV